MKNIVSSDTYEFPLQNTTAIGENSCNPEMDSTNITSFDQNRKQKISDFTTRVGSIMDKTN